MHWFLIGLLTPALSSVGNFIDKIIIERFSTKGATVGVLALYSSLFSIFVLIGILLLNPSVLSVPATYAGLLVIAGIIELMSVLMYLNAMKEEDASTIVPLFQTIPVFSLGLGFLILGEMLTASQSILVLGIVVGSMILTFDSEGRGFSRIKWTTLMLMLGSSFSFALYDALFKYGALEGPFWTAVFWQHVGIISVGAGILIFSSKYRKAFAENIQVNGPKVFGLNSLNELLYTLGVTAYSYALLLAPIAIVATVTAYQPIFVFLGGILFTIFLPHILKEDIRPEKMVQKIIAIGIIVGCSIWLALSSG